MKVTQQSLPDVGPSAQSLWMGFACLFGRLAGMARAVYERRILSLSLLRRARRVWSLARVEWKCTRNGLLAVTSRADAILARKSPGPSNSSDFVIAAADLLHRVRVAAHTRNPPIGLLEPAGGIVVARQNGAAVEDLHHIETLRQVGERGRSQGAASQTVRRMRGHHNPPLRPDSLDRLARRQSLGYPLVQEQADNLALGGHYFFAYDHPDDAEALGLQRPLDLVVIGYRGAVDTALSVCLQYSRDRSDAIARPFRMAVEIDLHVPLFRGASRPIPDPTASGLPILRRRRRTPSSRWARFP